MYNGARMLEILSKTNKTVSQLLENIPVYISTPEIKIESTDIKKREILILLRKYFKH